MNLFLISLILQMLKSPLCLHPCYPVVDPGFGKGGDIASSPVPLFARREARGMLGTRLGGDNMYKIVYIGGC